MDADIYCGVCATVVRYYGPGLHSNEDNHMINLVKESLQERDLRTVILRGFSQPVLPKFKELQSLFSKLFGKYGRIENYFLNNKDIDVRLFNEESAKTILRSTRYISFRGRNLEVTEKWYEYVPPTAEISTQRKTDLPTYSQYVGTSYAASGHMSQHDNSQSGNDWKIKYQNSDYEKGQNFEKSRPVSMDSRFEASSNRYNAAPVSQSKNTSFRRSEHQEFEDTRAINSHGNRSYPPDTHWKFRENASNEDYRLQHANNRRYLMDSESQHKPMSSYHSSTTPSQKALPDLREQIMTKPTTHLPSILKNAIGYSHALHQNVTNPDSPFPRQDVDDRRQKFSKTGTATEVSEYRRNNSDYQNQRASEQTHIDSYYPNLDHSNAIRNRRSRSREVVKQVQGSHYQSRNLKQIKTDGQMMRDSIPEYTRPNVSQTRKSFYEGEGAKSKLQYDGARERDNNYTSKLYYDEDKSLVKIDPKARLTADDYNRPRDVIEVNRSRKAYYDEVSNTALERSRKASPSKGDIYSRSRQKEEFSSDNNENRTSVVDNKRHREDEDPRKWQHENEKSRIKVDPPSMRREPPKYSRAGDHASDTRGGELKSNMAKRSPRSETDIKKARNAGEDSYNKNSYSDQGNSKYIEKDARMKSREVASEPNAGEKKLKQSYTQSSNTPSSDNKSNLTYLLEFKGDFTQQLSTLTNKLKRLEPASSAIYHAFRDIRDVIQHSHPDCRVFGSGSAVDNVSLSSKLIHCFIIFPKEANEKVPTISTKKMESKKIPLTLALLKQNNFTFTNVIVVGRRQSSAIQCQHVPTALELNIAFKTYDVAKINLIKFLITTDERLLPIFRFLKYWAEVTMKTFDNYTLYLLIIFYLQRLSKPVLPPVKFLQSDPVFDKFESGWNIGFDNNLLQIPKNENTSDIPTLIEDFFEFYYNFEFSDLVICPYIGLAIPCKAMEKVEDLDVGLERYTDHIKGNIKPQFHISYMNVQDPFILSYNVGSRSIPNTMRKTFQDNCYEAFIEFRHSRKSGKYEGLFDKLFNKNLTLTEVKDTNKLIVPLPRATELNEENTMLMFVRLNKMLSDVLNNVLKCKFTCKKDVKYDQEGTLLSPQVQYSCSAFYNLWSSRTNAVADVATLIKSETNISNKIINSLYRNQKPNCPILEFSVDASIIIQNKSIKFQVLCADSYMETFQEFKQFMQSLLEQATHNVFLPV